MVPKQSQDLTLQAGSAALTAGFAVIENCSSHKECDEIIERLSMITSAATRRLLENTWCQSLAGTLKQRLAIAVPQLAALLPVQCTYFDKSAASNWFVAFHQDRSIPVADSAEVKSMPGWSRKEGIDFVYGTDEVLQPMVAVRLHLDDSTVENGPLRVIPQSHKSGTLAPPEIAALVKNSGVHELTVKRGGVVLMHPLLLHASSKSRSSKRRRVLHFLFSPRQSATEFRW